VQLTDIPKLPCSKYLMDSKITYWYPLPTLVGFSLFYLLIFHSFRYSPPHPLHTFKHDVKLFVCDIYWQHGEP